MIKREIAFFDLDDTLWKIKDESVWIIDKDKPSTPLMKLDKVEFTMIKNGLYKKDNISLNYNGQKFYISKDIFEILKKRSGSENVDRFGISFIPLVKKDVLDGKDMDVLIKNIEHLRFNKFIDIGILTARSNRKTHADLVNNLRKKLKNIGIEISKIFFVGNSLRLGHDYYSKVKVLLEHLIGFKIIDGKFSMEKQDWYQKVSFYDDDPNNIDYANDIQKYLNNVLRKTDDNLFRIIINKIKENKIILETYLTTGNEINRFKKNIIILEEPTRFPMFEGIKKFEQFDLEDFSEEEIFGEISEDEEIDGRLLYDLKNSLGKIKFMEFLKSKIMWKSIAIIYRDNKDVSIDVVNEIVIDKMDNIWLNKRILTRSSTIIIQH